MSTRVMSCYLYIFEFDVQTVEHVLFSLATSVGLVRNSFAGEKG